MHIVLIEPEIPQNAGNIARTCAATNTVLHLVRPLGFSVEDKYLKRAGLDYWNLLEIHYYDSFDEIKQKYPDKLFYFATTKAKYTYADVQYSKDAFIVFGKESAGIPEEILKGNPDTCVRIPMQQEARSLNLSNSVAIILYEALRQNQFSNLVAEGNLTKYHW